MDLQLSKPFRLGKMPPTYSLIVLRGPTKGRVEGCGFKSKQEAAEWAEKYGHKITGVQK